MRFVIAALFGTASLVASEEATQEAKKPEAIMPQILDHSAFGKYMPYKPKDLSQQLQRIYEQTINPDSFQNFAHEFTNFFANKHHYRTDIDPLCGLGKPSSDLYPYLPFQAADSSTCQELCYNYCDSDCVEVSQMAIDMDYDSCVCAAAIWGATRPVAKINDPSVVPGCVSLNEVISYNSPPVDKWGKAPTGVGCEAASHLSDDDFKLCMCESCDFNPTPST
eukprot:GHVO01045374.1.p1 GENE.GHVO01045374.1~~GHVO01045374.1.p1  ORF type:complete len:222 (+),score=36.17 GHVO01045374.1:110-775(+)